MDLTKKQKRNAILYARIKEENKVFIERKAKTLNVKEAELIDEIIDKVREQEPKKKGKKK